MERLFVQPCSFLHVMGYIRDMNTKNVVPTGETLHLNGVVEVLRRLPVNGDDGLVPKIAPARYGAGRDLGGNSFRFLRRDLGPTPGLYQPSNRSFRSSS